MNKKFKRTIIEEFFLEKLKLNYRIFINKKIFDLIIYIVYNF